jgi:hypothetical protein
MARSVSVKIPTSVVIEMIETKLAELTKAEADYPKLLSAYKKEIATFTADLVDLVAKNKKSATEYSDFDFASGNFAIHSDWRGSVSIQIGKDLVSKIGTKPTKPEEVDNYGHKNKKAELEKTLKLLRLTEQETITSSTYNSVLDLL